MDKAKGTASDAADSAQQKASSATASAEEKSSTLREKASDAADYTKQKSSEFSDEAKDDYEKTKKEAKKDWKKGQQGVKDEYNEIYENRDNPVVIANGLAIVIGSVALAYGGYKKYSVGELDWKLAGAAGAVVGALGIGDYFLSQYVFLIFKCLSSIHVP